MERIENRKTTRRPFFKLGIRNEELGIGGGGVSGADDVSRGNVGTAVPGGPPVGVKGQGHGPPRPAVPTWL